MLTNAMVIEDCDPYYFKCHTSHKGASTDFYLSPDITESYHSPIQLHTYHALECWGCLTNSSGYPIAHNLLGLIGVSEENHVLQAYLLSSGYSYPNGFYSLTASSIAYPCYFLWIYHRYNPELVLLSKSTCEDCSYELEACKTLIMQQLKNLSKGELP